MRNQKAVLFLIFLCFAILTESDAITSVYSSAAYNPYAISTDPVTEKVSVNSSELEKLNATLKEHLINENYDLGKRTAEEIIRKTGNPGQENCVISDSYYYVGVYYMSTRDYDRAVKLFNQSVILKESLMIYDEIYAKALYNLGGIYSRLGDFKRHKEYTLRSLEAEKQIYGDESTALISTYGSLITACIELKEYDRALDLADITYNIVNKDPSSADPNYLAFLYHNLGVLYNSISDYSRSRVFLERAEEYYIKSGKTTNEGYIDLMNSMSVAFSNLGMTERSDQYYRKGISLAMENYSLSSFLILSNYAISEGNLGKISEGESVLSGLLSRVNSRYGPGSKSYHEVLGYYAHYLRRFNVDKERSLEYYRKCIAYFDKQGYSFMKYIVKEGCAILLSEKGEFEEAIRILNTILFHDASGDNTGNIFINPDIVSINADKDFLGILRTKYRILKEYYRHKPDLKILEAAAGTSELIISLLEKTRITISEEESRLLLGDRFRDSYLDVIGDFYELYNTDNNNYNLEKAFEYSERSKIAGLLTATRELKATQFHIPSELADLERNLQQESAILNDRISGRSGNENPSEEIVSIWKSNLFSTIHKRDSLIKIFENDYPEYYAIKYNTRVSQPGEIPSVFGRKSNYISYVASDTNIYINIINKRHHKMILVSVDSAFYAKVRKFRHLLSMPGFSNARNELREYYLIGNELYNTLIMPARPFLISDRVVISPDNLLSYLPFETLPVRNPESETLSFRDISFLMQELDISYTYSATFMAESIKHRIHTGNKVIAFAPDYSERLDIHSVFQRRQQSGNILSDLPYARHEAEYVSELLGGRLLLNDVARESLFKKEAGDYEIIHLAMHTVIDDNDPMYSTLIFSPEESDEEDRFLRTFEIYGIPLKAKMVVLSSCNTGVGKLFSGEGILSLARGFIYSGSESVVMSMWEIEDRTGTEVVKAYYDYLKRGYSKSIALKKARIKFLKTADQLRAHPYFWSALVIYGDNSPLFRPWWIYPALLNAILFLGILAYFYLRNRRYS
jgi:CHAT domain-containing protein